MQKRWKLLSADKKKIEPLQQSLKIHPIICQILVQRGIEIFDVARKFFRPQLQELHSPWLMKDMPLAVDRILDAIKKNEKILIYGDYDVDGTTSVALLYRFLKRNYTDIDFYIPHRYREGYGISKAGIDFAKDNNFTLIISLDCGIKSIELIAYAKELGIDFIVCDHHLPDDQLPPAVAILNPKQIDCPYPFKDLCGCGVTFKLMSALADTLSITDEELFEDIDLLATAIAADIVSMSGENRVLAFYGLQKANKNPNNGIKALYFLSGVTKELHINTLVFIISPRVNAAGRMDDAKKAVQLFIAETYEEALDFAEQLNSDNKDRKEVEKNITNEALSLIKENQNYITRNSTVLFQPHWHKGVVGIVASRLIENYFRPTIVLTQSGNFATGSARSVPGFNLYNAIYACKEYLVNYGGHFAAAGLTMDVNQVVAFSNKFEEVVSATITPELLIPEIVIDAEISLSDITWPFYNVIQQMEPFGPDNLRPVFIVKNVMDSGFSKIVKEEHIRFSLKQNQVTLTGIGFHLAEKFPILQMKKPVDVVFKIEENEFNGNKSLQLKVIDFRLCE
ncbi:MAG: single-stranded-DNA-specific exonuclease RecJ [Chitinophagaceae bacterium]|nr:MAG: single-stranded-DNA-specific exonuclease RecJ [Chitinophagaceae bacterium]